MGKTSIALAVEREHPEIAVYRGDTAGVPSADVMASYGEGYQPGGAWQRAFTLEWIEKLAPVLAGGKPVLFEAQMRPAFIAEGLALQAITHAQILLVECDDRTREARLRQDRQQPELANESMRGWSRYLHGEAVDAGYEIIDTGAASLTETVAHVVSYLVPT